MVSTLFPLLAWAALAGATPLRSRAVDSLDEAATAEAHQRDDGATRAFSNVEIRTSDGKCLFVNKLSGDFRANLTPVQVADCGSTDGQGWDVITAGEHIKGDGVMLIVSTLTQACFNFDPRRQAGNQVLLFSCGGRADGGGQVTNSQLFSFDGSAGPLSLKPRNQEGSCLVVKGNAIDIANCDAGDANQSFTFGDAAAGGGNNGNGNGNNGGKSTSTCTTSTCTKTTRTVTATPTQNDGNAAIQTSTPLATQTTTSAPAAGSGGGTGSGAGSPGIPTVNPTDPVPVSRAGGTLQPTAAAESHQRDDTAKRAFSGVSIRAPNGQCLFIDPTAGDFRQNLIPVSLVDCSGSPNEKWDVITEGKHNKPNPNQPAALVVSALTQGCISFDGRRQAGDTVTLFSCGGRAAGEGETTGSQLFPFIGQTSFAFAPVSENNNTCILPGNGRLDSEPAMPRLRCANPPATAGLFVQLCMRRQTLPSGLSILDVLLPLSFRSAVAPVIHGYHASSAARNASPLCILPTSNRRPWGGPAPRAGLMETQTVSGGLASRSFSTSSPLEATHAIFNRQLDDDGKEMMLEITPRAAKRLSEIMTKDSNPNLALRIQVESGGCHGFQYLMKLVTLPPSLPTADSLASATEEDSSAAIRQDDTIFTYSPDGSSPGDLTAPKIILDLPSLELLKGSKVDFTMELIGSQFKIVDNPLATSSCGCGTSFDIKI
ncbi:putative iron-sulfur protein [Achaetomium macrosporum]|uniref:Iron-sulfur protein n=1 Tax=Achaetomium macrosporum TaxID=79813 RepID=A0AAN7C8P7_9PEZI|nr:putative iron-sulfur protein [Achaetomium macrosporum]